ncbi:MAG: tRNA preQ1(34) S-adenosylmethionine ribosyltransferase-isomerase QueA, partial [Treponemataceae bacterium]|nr:tRNA preQ1(34) S-adenosylmethionine ribosyltransferase-isomerase QueA [Treponemataceae bacterium]
MKRTDFYFDLPPELIAQYPSERRGNDRLMVLGRKSGEVSHRAMSDLPNLIESGTLMVFNNSRVRKARVFGTKESTGREVEFIFLNKVDDASCVWNTLVKGAKKQKPGMRYEFPDSSVGTILENPQNEGTEFRTVKFDFALTESWFEKNGHIPLPPYIRRADDEADSERYQNVFADNVGSAACPTAGLHFTNEMLETLERKKIDRAFITLHVGLGTFLPVREDNIEDHKMHEEIFTVESDAARKINQAKKEGRPILAVGTTSVRTLESACVAESGAW